ncbi:unnamed protein product [Lupinus luteus]|uniref:DNA polymerase III subunit gamma/tau helical lid domain-containing protein n=1 Tax=Lupinus luteus TaxID=3873 RepID=A0AAV1XA04_LUPLU
MAGISQVSRRTTSAACDAYIVARLRKISAHENLDVEIDALDLIVMNADGSLRDVETMLEQLSLLGKRITTSIVDELLLLSQAAVATDRASRQLKKHL